MVLRGFGQVFEGLLMVLRGFSNDGFPNVLFVSWGLASFVGMAVAPRLTPSQVVKAKIFALGRRRLRGTAIVCSPKGSMFTSLEGANGRGGF